jgi:shikimate kinase
LSSQKKRSSGAAHSAITVVSALASGKGVTIGTDIPCRVLAALSSKKTKDLTPQILVSNGLEDPHHLVESCVKSSLRYAGVKLLDTDLITIEIDSQIPVAQGLKSSSAISVAIVLAVLRLFEKEIDILDALRISSKASKASGASLTGAYDDAAACLLGGIVFSNNLKFRLLKHERVPADLGAYVKLLVPLRERKLTSSIDRNAYRRFLEESREAYRFAYSGEFAQAMLLNSIIQCVTLGYSIRPIVSALAEGATASGISGKGPAISALCTNSRIGARVAKRWLEENEDREVLSAKIVQPENLK